MYSDSTAGAADVGAAIRAAVDELALAGLAVLPVQPGTKRPAVQWKGLQGKRPTEAQLAAWFAPDRLAAGVGVGAIMGTVSGGVELTEIEGRAAEQLPAIAEAMRAAGLALLWKRLQAGWLEVSPSRGVHWLYRLELPTGESFPGNTKIAQRPAGEDERGRPIVEVLAETRGEGGYVVLAPTPGTHHDTGRPWVRVKGGPLFPAVLTLEERAAFHAVLRDVLDEMPEPPARSAARTDTAGRTDAYGDGESPVEHYNRVTDWETILAPNGWTHAYTKGNGERHWFRPGKDRGQISATTDRPNDDGASRLYVFSTSTDLEAEVPLTKAYVLAHYAHGGDMSAASSRLRREGYGDPLEGRPSVFTDEELAGIGAGTRERAHEAPREAAQAGGNGEDEVTDRDEYARTLQARLVFHRADRAARRQVDAEDRTAQAVATDVPLTTGAAFILDQPDKVPARWGQDEEILWAKGEALMIVGPPGVGKTTLVGQLVHALLGLQGEVLGYPVEPVGRVLYLAMDRPRQIGRALARCFTEAERDALDERLTVHQGPPPADLAQDTDKLLEMAQAAGADVVIVDSLKDAAVGLSEDAVGAGYNRARQKLLAAGIDLVELHHQKKNGANGGKPNTLPDVYGSTWLTSGAGSVVLLWADVAGASVVQLSHLKPVMEPVGPFDVIHDHTAGRSQVDGQVDLVALAGANVRGITVGMAAEALFGVDKPSKDQREKARRRIRKLVDAGLLEVAEPISDGKGHDLSTYRPRRGPAGEALDLDGLR